MKKSKRVYEDGFKDDYSPESVKSLRDGLRAISEDSLLRYLSPDEKESLQGIVLKTQNKLRVFRERADREVPVSDFWFREEGYTE